MVMVAPAGPVRNWSAGARVDPYVVFPGAEDVQIVDGDLERAHDRLMAQARECARNGDADGWAAAWTNAAVVAVQLGWYRQAERRLAVVLTTSERIPLDPDVIAEARMTLANLRFATGREAEAERELTAWRDVYPPDSFEAATYRESLAVLYAESGRAPLARVELTAALAVYEALRKPIRILEARATLAWVLLETDQHEAGEALFVEVRQAFVEIRRPDRVAACDYNWANHLVSQERFEDSDAYFDAAADGLAAAGMHHQLANLQWNRARRLMAEAESLDEGDSARQLELQRSAADVAISAVIATGYERFQFEDAPRRAGWLQRMGARLAKAFRLTYQSGSPQLVADLIESAISAGVYATSVPMEPTDDDYPVAPLERGAVGGPSASSESSDRPPALLLGAAVLLSTASLPVTPPPALIDGSGRELLRPQRAMAARLDPDLDRILAAAPRVAIW